MHMHQRQDQPRRVMKPRHPNRVNALVAVSVPLRTRPVRAGSDLGRPVDHRASEVQPLLDDGGDREAEEMRVLVCDHLAPPQRADQRTSCGHGAFNPGDMSTLTEIMDETAWHLPGRSSMAGVVAY